MESHAPRSVALTLSMKPNRRPVLRTGHSRSRISGSGMSWSKSMKLVVTGILAGATVSLGAGVATGHFSGTIQSTMRHMESLRQLATVHRRMDVAPARAAHVDIGDSDAIRATMVALTVALNANEHMINAPAELYAATAPGSGETIATAPEALPAAEPALDSATLQQMATRAEQAIKSGNIDAARLILSRAADAGDMTAVFGLAQTYDPSVLARLKVRGLTGDPDRAKALYQQAADGGVEAARGRLAALN